MRIHPDGKCPLSCNFDLSESAIVAKAEAGERPPLSRAFKPVGEQGSLPAVSSNPNSRLGRSKRSPIVQGWDRMDARIVGIDVSKDRLDVHIHPDGEAFAVARNAQGIGDLSARLQGLGVALIALEATGGFNRSSPPVLRRLGCRWLSSIRRRCVPLPMRLANAPRRTPSTPW